MRKRVSIKNPEIYKYYRTTVSNPIQRELYYKVFREFFELVVQNIYSGSVFRIPGNLGEIMVVKRPIDYIFDEEGNFDYKASSARTDWGATKKLWEEYPHLQHKKYLVYENEHTRGHSVRIYWNRRARNIKNLKHYMFKPARIFSRGLAKYINKHPEVEYYKNPRA